MKLKEMVFYVFLLFFTISIHSQNTIDLLETCEGLNCTPKSWFVQEGFSKDSLLADSQTDNNWKPVNNFPIYPWEYFPSNENIKEYSLRLDFTMPSTLFHSLRHKGIVIGGIGEVYEIYLNGILIAKEGSVENGKITLHRALRGKVYEINQTFFKENQNRLLIHLWGRPNSNNTGIYFTKGNEIGYYSDLKHKNEEKVIIALIGIYFLISFYHLFLFLNRKREIYNFYFGLFSLCIGIYTLSRTNLIFDLEIDTLLIRKIEYSILYVNFIAIFLFTQSLFYNKISKIIKLYAYIHFLIAFITLLSPEFVIKKILSIWQITSPITGLPLMIYLMYSGLKDKIPSARRLLLGTILLTSAAVFDLIDARFFGSGFTITKYAFCFYIIGIAGILAKNFTELHERTEQLNETLEKRVEARTKRLSESFEEITILKNQQDGDYYLTSLLIEPLATNNTAQDLVKIEFLIKQKKEFKYKNNLYEIGGDICKSETILLNNQRLTVFLNADAMGKSMQGAGGILVLGSVFKSIIERTSFSNFDNAMSPERWLKNSFVELHKVFASFDGSMVVSIVIGIIEDKTGLMYFINAEHPRSILYRDNKATYIENIESYQKLGSQLLDGFVRVQTFPLKRGDVILNGSDGRDDILIKNEMGNEVINTNETFILTIVEKANAHLPSILKLIENSGTIVDDISLMRVDWHGEISTDSYKDKSIAVNYLENGNDLKVVEHLYKYLEFHPEDSEMIQLLSESLIRLSKYLEAIEFLERIRIREPKKISILLLLIESYHNIKNFDRVEILIKNVLQFDPKNSEILQYQNSRNK